MKNYQLIFMILPNVYALLGYIFYTTENKVFGVIMITFSLLFGLLSFAICMPVKNNTYRKPSLSAEAANMYIPNDSKKS